MSEVVMCSKCKTWVQPGAKTCPKCGAAIVTREMVNQQMDAVDEAKEQKKKYIALIISLVIILFSIPMVKEDPGFISGIMFGFLPCGWVGTTAVRKKTGFLLSIIPIGWAAWAFIAACAAMLTGFVFLPIYLVQFIVSLVKKFTKKQA